MLFVLLFCYHHHNLIFIWQTSQPDGRLLFQVGYNNSEKINMEGSANIFCHNSLLSIHFQCLILYSVSLRGVCKSKRTFLLYDSFGEELTFWLSFSVETPTKNWVSLAVTVETTPLTELWEVAYMMTATWSSIFQIWIEPHTWQITTWLSNHQHFARLDKELVLIMSCLQAHSQCIFSLKPCVGL